MSTSSPAPDFSGPDASAPDSVEVAELVDFLSTTTPFDTLPSSSVRHAARALEIRYAPAGTTLLDLGEPNDRLTLLRSGAVDLFDDEDQLVARLGERDFFGYPSLLTDAPARRRVVTIEDALLYDLPEAVFDQLRSQSDAFDRFFARAHAERIRTALDESREQMPLSRSVASLLRRPPVAAPANVSIRDAAAQMRDERVSSLLLTEDGALKGILTDRDLRTRVVAEGRDPDTPVREIMTPDPVTLSADATAAEALITMSRHNVHHLPVERADDPAGSDAPPVAGVVSTTDLMRVQADSPVYLIGEVRKQTSVDGLVEVSRRLPSVIVHLADTHARAEDASRVVTAVSDALTQRLLERAEADLGPPPVPYAWLALGSQARREQTAHSDQDNALILSDDYEPDRHGTYFEDLATIVCDGLDACGFEYCPGEVMAVTDRWRQPLRAWKQRFRTWIEEPEPPALMHASIFFDLRAVYGQSSLAEELRQYVLDRTPGNSIFLACLTVNALSFTPPLGFFRQFVLDTHGDQEDTLDLKQNGLVPIVDIARIAALAQGLSPVHTLSRLRQAAGGTGLAASDASDLEDAYAFIASIRLRHQAQRIRNGQPPNNFVSPDALSAFDRRHLKDAFRIISRMQSALEQRYQTGLISR
jgi:CBS domain-containing protein